MVVKIKVGDFWFLVIENNVGLFKLFILVFNLFILKINGDFRYVFIFFYVF